MKKSLTSLPPVRSTEELASHLGLSRWTVSRALNGHEGIRRETAERVRAAARELGFLPDVFGRGLRAGRLNWVGVGLPDLVDYFLTNKLTRLQAALHELGQQSVVQIMEPTEEGERAVLERFQAMKCSAVVLIASRLPPDDARLMALELSDVPVVRIDPAKPGGKREVSTDRAHAMRLAVRRLHEWGHRRVALAGIDAGTIYGRQRLEGIRRGCSDCGWDFSRDVRVLPEDAVGMEEFGRGYRLGEKMRAELVDGFYAVLAVNDRVAMGLIRALNEAGLRVPEDVSVMGYDDADFSAYANPPLSTVDPRVDALIDRAMGLLQVANDAAHRLTVRPRLVERASLARVLPVDDKRESP